MIFLTARIDKKEMARKMKRKWLKKSLAFVLAMVLCVPTGLAASAQPITQTSQEETVYLDAEADGSRTQSFNEGWKFYLGDPSTAYQKNFDDSSWRSLTLPRKLVGAS